MDSKARTISSTLMTSSQLVLLSLIPVFKLFQICSYSAKLAVQALVKVEDILGHSTTLLILGILLDTIVGKARLPDDKFSALQQELHTPHTSSDPSHLHQKAVVPYRQTCLCLQSHSSQKSIPLLLTRCCLLSTLSMIQNTKLQHSH